VYYGAVLGAAGRRIDLPALRGRLHQHDARRCARLAERNVHAANRGRGAGHLDADERIDVDLVVRRRMLDGDLVDVDLQLFGDQHRQRGVGALAHLDHGHHERHLARAIDAQERVRREGRISRERVADLAARGQADGENQSAGGFQEVSTRAPHVTPPYR
jgi:hypothetical protein